jgi:hypothetical protein
MWEYNSKSPLGKDRIKTLIKLKSMKNDHDKFVINVGQMTKLPHLIN